MTKHLIRYTLLHFTTALLFFSLSANAIAEQRESFNAGWRFYKGEADGAEEPGFDDTAWRSLSLPHDWAIEGPFDIKYNARCGGLPFHGTGWYRKKFVTPKHVDGNRVAVEFDGAMYNAHVWVNGKHVGNRPFGYIGFEFDITRHLRAAGEENVIAVRLTPEDLSSRWYPGAGIYRNTWLTVRPAIHIDHWGVAVTTSFSDEKTALVNVETEVANTTDQADEIDVKQTITDADGKMVAEAVSPVALRTDGTTAHTMQLSVANVQRWDVQSPHLYTLKTELLVNDEVTTARETTFGVREIAFDAKRGFFLNGRRVQLNGVCMHHDLGPLGAAVNRRATLRQLEIMKEMGVNAIRTSHNPPSPEQLEFCDQLGLLVIDEAFDCWEKAKVPNGYNKFFKAWHERDLRDMIRRDRNHPSIILWSIGNEILEQGDQQNGYKVARLLSQICHDEDPTRLSTAGFNYYPASYKNRLAHQIDVVGLNYKPMFYGEAIEKEPDFVLLGSETSSCVSSRGTYHLPIEAYQWHESLQVTSYDLIGPKWAYPPDVEFMQLKKHPRLLGEFVWTGFDYLGEPTPYGGRDNSTNGYWNSDWPSRSSYFGCVDLCGFPKDRYYLYQSQWTTEPMVHLLPHWNWEGHEGKEIPVYCYTNCEEAELFLNGKSLGKRRKGVDTTPIKVDCYNWPGGDMDSPYRLRWDVPFESGKLEVVASSGGSEQCRKTIETAGAPARITLAADRNRIQGSENDLSFVTVRIVDAKGRFCPEADNTVTFEVSGPGSLVAVGNGNAATTESFQAKERKAFNGMCLAIIGATDESGGTATLRASSNGLTPAEVEIAIER